MFQESEVINLIMGIISVLLFIHIYIFKIIPKFKMIYSGFILIVCAQVFTVVEGIFWNDFFNLLEHLCLALAGVFCAIGSIVLVLRPVNDREVDRWNLL